MNYQQIYQKLMKRGKEKRIFITKYGRLERHHVIPKHVGGTNDACNITTLHHEEHILAHHLLWKIYGAAHYFHLPIYTIDNWSRRGSKGWSRIAAGKA